ncbi:protealysin inhibitor emfourin [Nocardioides lijunqiniae]|uniref:protealysin inhibitor emfourin n=1 Tax=Nocardioides lijunqiniae TaxID=2760832 RepID=UPI00187756AB|nr:protealysin inhibitor emfourin [Nocardioides lijunqiniae]
MSRTRCFLPPYLLQHLASARPDVAARWEGTLAVDERLRSARLMASGRMAAGPSTGSTASTAAGGAWVVHTAGNGTDLPGDVVRSPGDEPSGDLTVDEAAVGIAGSLALFEEVYGRSSYDGEGATVSLTVHYGRDYANAFWDGTQLVFGDGDGEVFDRFTKPVDVLAHELAHAVTEHTAGLEYQGQSGALNESVSDVFAACLKQRLLAQTPLEADWLIGEGLFLPGVDARGLRDMANPGTAYDDPALGRDPQPAHLDDYVDTTDDNGGVHLNSGIPNRAFHLAALGIGGTSWDGAGRVWYAALTGGQVHARTDFAGFAAATVAAARELGGAEHVEAAWEQVGITPATVEDGRTGGPGLPPPPGSESARSVRVRRGGGFAGLTTEAEVDLDGDDERAGELRGLVERIDLTGLRTGRPQPDRFVYDVQLPGASARVFEQDLTEDLRRVVELVLDQ